MLIAVEKRYGIAYLSVHSDSIKNIYQKCLFFQGPKYNNANSCMMGEFVTFLAKFSIFRNGLL